MAFQDNSGTIILDAVLTDVGRKRMVQGNFKVTKFLVGDDEIDYSLINMDTEDFSNVQAQPLFEAFEAEYANINYGLVSYPSNDIVYIPEMKVNTKLKKAVMPYNLLATDGQFLVAANKETAKKIKTITGQERFFLENGNYSNLKLLVESGITEQSGLAIGRSKLARERYIINVGLLDSHYAVSCDSRFIETLLSSKESAYINNDSAGRLYANFQPLQRRTKTSLTNVLDTYESYIIPAAPNHLFNHNGSGMDCQHSMFVGPRASMFAINFKLHDRLCANSGSTTTDVRYSKFGTLNTAVLGGSNKFDFIDTVIYVEGLTTATQLQIPLKILRYSGT